MRRLLLFGAFLVSVSSADEKSVFRPGDFFDPFREKSFADNQPSASVVPSSGANFAQANIVFSPFKEVTQSTDLVGYPRRIGKVSGTVEQFNAQLWHPNEFFNNFAKYQKQAVQQQPVQQRPQATGLTIPLIRVDTPKAQARKFEHILPEIAYGAPKVVANERIPQIKTNKAFAVPYQNVRAEGYPKHNQASTANAEPSNVVLQASKLLEQASDYGSYSYPNSHSASKSSGGGKSHQSGHHASHGDKEVKGYKSDHHHDKGDHKNFDDYDKKSHHKEKGSNRNNHHDEAEHYKKHHEGAKSHKAAKFGEKKGHKRGHKTKGYHNKFHKDEYHREHRFYDDYNKEGYHDKHGEGHSHYKDEEGGHKDGGSHDSGHSSKDHGKKDYSSKGKHEDEDKGFSKEGGGKKYHKHHEEHHKAGGSVKGKKYGYNEKH